jgi:predicted DNA-binding ribbon-helix-helix protein
MEASIILKTVSGHYTESNLVKILEEIGIGRPSTFAMLVDKIQEREYVKMDTIKPIKLNCLEYVLNKDNKMFQTKIVQKETGGEKNKLLLQPIGRIVSDFLEKHFSDIFNYKYTKQMEDGLDMIAKGNKQMTELCSECDTLLEKCLNSLKSSGLKKIQHRFNSTHTFLISKMGPCIHTSNPERFISVRKEYKDNFNMEMFDKIQKGEIKLEDMMEIADVSDIKVISVNVKSNEDIQNETQKQIMQNNITFYELGLYNGMKIFIKTGKYGPFVSLENVCQSTELLYGGIGKKTKKPVITVTKPFKTISLKSLGENRGLDSYTYDEIVEIIEGKNTLINPNILREISVNMSIRRGPKGSLYIYFKNDSIKKPMFYKLKGFTDDPIICPLETLQDWIKQKYNVY